MNIKEFDEFKLTDQIKFHDKLNPDLFTDDHLDTDVRKQLLKIAEDFKAYLGVKELDVKDIVITGSNAAYTYTSYSDIDLHLIVDIEKLHNDDVYKELFNAKKIVYNDKHDIKIRGYDVELYVEDRREPAKSLGEYSVLNNRWIKYPSKRRANFDERSTLHKFQKLIQLAELALRSTDVANVDALLKTLKKYRQAGLDVGGEFSPENLAYKILRNKGIVDQLYNHSDKLHSEMLSIDESDYEYMSPGAGIRDTIRIQSKTQKKLQPNKQKFIWLRPGQISGSHSEHILKKLGFKQSFTGSWGGTKTMWDELFNRPCNATLEDKLAIELKDFVTTKNEDFHPNETPPGPEFKPTMPAGTVKVDVSDVYDWYKLGQHVSNLKGLGKHDFGKGPPSTIMAFGSEDEEHKYIDALEKTGLTTTDIDPVDPKQPKGMKRQKVDTTYNVSEASGYIPSEKEKNDWRFKTALTVDVKSTSIKDNAKKLGLGKIHRSGVPPVAKTDGKLK